MERILTRRISEMDMRFHHGRSLSIMMASNIIAAVSTKQQFRGSALTNFLMSRTGIKWDAATANNITVDDLDIPNVELLDKLDLLVDGKLKRAGALCFYRNAEKVISGCYVKIRKFEGSELLYQDEVQGSLLLLLRLRPFPSMKQ